MRLTIVHYTTPAAAAQSQKKKNTQKNTARGVVFCLHAFALAFWRGMGYNIIASRNKPEQFTKI
jgi:hypothetical protein